MFARPPSLSQSRTGIQSSIVITDTAVTLSVSQSVCLFVFSVLIIQSGQPVIISLLEGTYNTISHLQPPVCPLSSFYYSQPGAGPDRWASRQHLVKMQDGDFVCPKYHMPDGEAQPGHDLGLLIRKQAIFINWSNKHQIHIYSDLLYVHHFFYLCPSIVSLFIFIENICIRKEKGCF